MCFIYKIKNITIILVVDIVSPPRAPAQQNKIDRLIAESGSLEDLSMNEEHPDDDPFELKELAVNYDYLIYKINDTIATLSEKTFQSINNKNKLINESYLNDQLQLNEELQDIDKLITQSKDLEMTFMKLDQLNLFVEDFKSRISYLEDEFDKL